MKLVVTGGYGFIGSNFITRSVAEEDNKDFVVLSFTIRFFSSIPSSAEFSFTNFIKDNVSNSFSPLALRMEFNDVFKKLFVLTPGISKDIETVSYTHLTLPTNREV